MFFKYIRRYPKGIRLHLLAQYLPSPKIKKINRWFMSHGRNLLFAGLSISPLLLPSATRRRYDPPCIRLLLLLIFATPLRSLHPNMQITFSRIFLRPRLAWLGISLYFACRIKVCCQTLAPIVGSGKAAPFNSLAATAVWGVRKGWGLSGGGGCRAISWW